MARLSFGSLLLFGLPMWGVNLSRNSFASCIRQVFDKGVHVFLAQASLLKSRRTRSLSLPIDFSHKL